MIDTTPDDTKLFWKSKTFWASVVSVVLPLIPQVSAFRAENQVAYDGLFAIVFGALLRTTTTQPIQWKISKKF